MEHADTYSYTDSSYLLALMTFLHAITWALYRDLTVCAKIGNQIHTCVMWDA